MVEISALLPLAGLVKLKLPMMRATINHGRITGEAFFVMFHSMAVQTNLISLFLEPEQDGKATFYPSVVCLIDYLRFLFPPFSPRGCTHYSILTPGQLRDATFCRSSYVVY